MAVSTATRYFSLALLFLSVAPWASLWALIVTIQFRNSSLLFVSSLNAEDTASTSLSAILSNSNVTLEELWLALFQDSWVPSATRAGESHYQSTNLSSLQSAYHWTVVLPWVVSLLLGLLVPLLVTLSSYCGIGGRHAARNFVDPNEDPWISRLCRNERRLSRLLCTLKEYRMTLSEKDIDVFDLDYEKHPKWKVPLPGMPASFPGTRGVVGTCSVCLGTYMVGESVIWSPNCLCVHVFHEDCITSWLLRRRRQCPCCRRPFLTTGPP